MSLEWAAALIKIVCNVGAMDSTSFYIKIAIYVKQIHSPQSPLNVVKTYNRGRTETYTVFISAMSSSENTYCSAVLVIVILVFSLMNDPVIGKPLLGSSEEECPDFQFTYLDKMHLMEKYMMYLTANIMSIMMYMHAFMFVGIS